MLCITVMTAYRTVAHGVTEGDRACEAELGTEKSIPAVNPKGLSTARKVFQLLPHTPLSLRNLVSKCSGLRSCSLEITRNHNFLFRIPTDRVMKKKTVGCAGDTG